MFLTIFIPFFKHDFLVEHEFIYDGLKLGIVHARLNIFPLQKVRLNCCITNYLVCVEFTTVDQRLREYMNTLNFLCGKFTARCSHRKERPTKTDIMRIYI